MRQRALSLQSLPPQLLVGLGTRLMSTVTAGRRDSSTFTPMPACRHRDTRSKHSAELRLRD